MSVINVILQNVFKKQGNRIADSYAISSVQIQRQNETFFEDQQGETCILYSFLETTAM